MPYRTRPGETQWAARQRIARAKGYKGYGSYRRASAQHRQQASQRLANRDASYRYTGSPSTIATRARRDVTTPAGRVLSAAGDKPAQMRRLYRALREVPPRTPVTYRACVDTPRGFRTITGTTSAGDLVRRLSDEHLAELAIERATGVLEEDEPDPDADLEDFLEALDEDIAKKVHQSPPKRGEPATPADVHPHDIRLETISVTIPETTKPKRRRRTRAELLDEAKRLGIRGRHGLSRDQLLRRLQRARRLEAETF